MSTFDLSWTIVLTVVVVYNTGVKACKMKMDFNNWYWIWAILFSFG